MHENTTMNMLDRFFDSASSTADTARDRARLAAQGNDRPSFGAVALVGLLGAAGGAAASFLFDPARGRARRARLVDQGAAVVRQVVRNGEQAVKQVRSTVDARVAAVRAEHTPQARAMDDATLTDRVRSIVFRDESVPKGDLNINVERGIVVLRGEVPDEALKARIVSEVEAIDGVWSVRDLLHLPGEPAVTSAAT
jgi:osmotically-inducible protein OsmY